MRTFVHTFVKLKDPETRNTQPCFSWICIIIINEPLGEKVMTYYVNLVGNAVQRVQRIQVS